MRHNAAEGGTYVAELFENFDELESRNFLYIEWETDMLKNPDDRRESRFLLH